MDRFGSYHHKTGKEFQMAASDFNPSIKNESGGGHASKQSSEYRSWKMMKARCCNPNATGYHRYGGRGITVCERWQKSLFINFPKDMGPSQVPSIRLTELTTMLDIDPTTASGALANSSSKTKRQPMLTYKGETACMKEWSRRIGISQKALQQRLESGWSVEKSIRYRLFIQVDDVIMLTYNDETMSLQESGQAGSISNRAPYTNA